MRSGGRSGGHLPLEPPLETISNLLHAPVAGALGVDTPGVAPGAYGSL